MAHLGQLEDDPQLVQSSPDVQSPDEDEVALFVAPPPPALRVDTVLIEAWVSTPKLKVDTSFLEAWVSSSANLRVGQSVLEAWISGGGALRVATVLLEAWVPAPVAQLNISVRPPVPPKLGLGSSWVTRGLSVNAGPPQLAESASSLTVFPALPGLTWPIEKELEYGVQTQQEASGKNLRVSQWADPIWHYTLTYEFLRQGDQFLEQQALLGLFLQMLGQYGHFLYDDTDDDTATNVVFGDAIYTVSGPAQTQTVYQLLRNFYDNSGNVIASAPVYAPVPGSIEVRVGTAADGSGGTVNTDWVLGSNGRIIFNSPIGISGPPGSHNWVAWSGSYLQVCRFEDDQQDFEGLWNEFFELRQLRFKTVKPT